MVRGCKLIKLETISTQGNRLYWTRFSINWHHPSTCHKWVPARTFFPLTRLTQSSAQLSHPLFTLTHNFPQLSHNNLNTLSHVMFLQYWEYFLLINVVVICKVFFFLKKKLEHIREIFVFFCFSVNIVINLFVSILWLVYLLVYCDYLLVFFFFFKLILWLIIKSVITLKLLMLCPKN